MTSKFENITLGTHTLNDGKQIPMVGLGISRIDGQEALDIAVSNALAAGYRLFDTAHIYENEKELGESLKKLLPKYDLTREDIFITTKVPTKDENTAERTEQLVQESLQKLQTDYVDMMLIHFPRDRDTGSDENYEINKRGRKIVWQKLEELQARGLVRSIGVSNYEVYHIVEMLEYAKVLPALNQVEYTPYCTRPTLKKYCEQKGIFVQAFASLCKGNQEILNEPHVKNLAIKYDVTPQTILYAFAVRTGVGIIPKSANPKRIYENLHKVAAATLTPEEAHDISLFDRNQAFCPRCFPWRCL